jgi:hypothetical protein
MLAYVAAPFSGDVQENMRNITEICQQIYEEYPEYTILSPLHNHSFLDETADWHKVLKHCLELLSKCEVLILTGDWEMSQGCLMEFQYAKEHRIPVVFWEGR